jgi:hypothetical protein
MERLLMEDLVRWKNKKKRKPLIIHGACVKIGLNQEKPYK